MSNEVQTQPAGGAVAALSGLKQGLANVTKTMPSSNTDPFMRMAKDGTWIYGADNVDVQDGSLWAINIMSLQHGFSCWTNYNKKKNEKKGEVMVSSSQPLPERATLPVYHDDDGNTCDWREQYSFPLQCMSGEDTGMQTLYNTTSFGGTAAVKNLLGAVMLQLDKDPGNPIPLVALQNDSYQHPKYGKTYNPVFVIKKWAPLAEDASEAMEQATEPTPADNPPVEPEETASAPTAAQTAPSEETTTNDATPVRRRRRRPAA